MIETGLMVVQGRTTVWCTAERSFETGEFQYHLRAHVDELPAHMHKVFDNEPAAQAAMAEIAPLSEWKPIEIDEE